ncbi:MAG: dihydroorotate dehydrogenase electron transfer subunit [Oscillospiraceae bacterium]|nr:dihydroorotate dehydrogenase electron transfer subunit [Oscillospiraceae bacterium]
MLSKHYCEVVENIQLSKDIFKVTVVCKSLANDAAPGQFLHIKCGDERLLRRPISICAVVGNAVELVFELKGEGTQWLSKIAPGNKLDILGPLGSGFNIPKGKTIVLGGGIGVPPMLFVAESATSKVTAILGFRSMDRVILKEAFELACAQVYITTDDGSFGIHGSVIKPLLALLETGEYEAVLACGPHVMLTEVARVCKLHAVPLQVSLEERMGCGVGACLVCACATIKDGNPDMSRVCFDGPVFCANDIVW